MKLIDKLRTLVATAWRPTPKWVTPPSPKGNIRPSGKDWTQLEALSLTIAEFNEARQDKYLNLVDCRELMEWKQEHIPGSINIPMNQLPSRLSEIDPAALIIVYSNTGDRSYSVTQYLMDANYQAKSLQGGLAAWKESGNALESDYHYDKK